MYIGEEDSSYFMRDKISQADVMRRVNRVLEGVAEVPNIGRDF